ncbi:MAG: GtrA family protein [bacterium]|nr:GtrA family protein [bacterium]
MTKFFESEIVRFVIVGGVNTGLTQLLYMGLLFVMSYTASYTVSYVAGIFLSYWLNSRYVFRQPLQWSKALQFPLVYLAQYVLGVALLYVMIEWLGVHEMIAPLPVVALIVPVTFLMSRYIIKRPGKTPVGG